MPQTPHLSEDEFVTLIKREGLSHSADELPEFYKAYGYVMAMIDRVRQPRSHMAEPALTFDPLQGAE